MNISVVVVVVREVIDYRLVVLVDFEHFLNNNIISY